MLRLFLIIAMSVVILAGASGSTFDTVHGREIICENDFAMSEREECLKECRFKYGSGFQMNRWTRVKKWKYAECVRE